jgi:peptide/nickel transport system permease protein
MRADLGLDKSFPQQYIEWVGGVIQGDLGTSLWTGRDVLDTLATRSRVSLQLALMAMFVAVLTAIPLGIISAVRQDSWLDYAARMFSITGLSVPDFFLATMLLYVLSVWVGWLPDFGYTPPWEDPWANVQAFIFPALIVGYRFSAISARMTRSAMLEVLRQDYVRTARAKGLVERVIIFKHALRNALIPVITIMGSQLTFLLGGLVIIEVVFSLPGVGTLGFEAIQVRDYPVVQGVVFFTAILFISANLLVDLSYAVIDPRIRYS